VRGSPDIRMALNEQPLGTGHYMQCELPHTGSAHMQHTLLWYRWQGQIHAHPPTPNTPSWRCRRTPAWPVPATAPHVWGSTPLPCSAAHAHHPHSPTQQQPSTACRTSKGVVVMVVVGRGGDASGVIPMVYKVGSEHATHGPALRSTRQLNSSLPQPVGQARGWW
jgi:hypothetical protein